MTDPCRGHIPKDSGRVRGGHARGGQGSGPCGPYVHAGIRLRHRSSAPCDDDLDVVDALAGEVELPCVDQPFGPRPAPQPLGFRGQAPAALFGPDDEGPDRPRIISGGRYGSGRPQTRAARWWRPCGGRPPIGLDHLKFRNSKCLESGDGSPLARECRRFSETRCFYAGGHSRESMSSRKRGEGTRFGRRIPKLENHASCHDMDAVIAFPRAAPRVEDPPRRDPGRS